MNPLVSINRWPWYARWPVKVAILGLTVAVVCFPYPRMLARNVGRWMDPDRLIEPDHPRLQPWLAELRSRLPQNASADDKLRQVERFVYDKIPYEWDWNTWGVADYLPTVAEVVDQGREDCDGRAVVAASLLRNFGFDAHLVNDLTHVWVRTEAGDTMSPGRDPVITTTNEGRKVRLPNLTELLRAVAVGIAVFPAFRELIIMVALWLLLIRPGIGWPAGASGAMLLCTSLVLLRLGGSVSPGTSLWLQNLGGMSLLAGVVLLTARGARAAHRAPADDPEAASATAATDHTL